MMIMDYYKQSKVKKQRQQLEEQVRGRDSMGGVGGGQASASSSTVPSSRGKGSRDVLGSADYNSLKGHSHALPLPR